MKTLTHLAEDGSARMVDVGGKPDEVRVAKAEVFVRMAASTMAILRDGGAPKGDVAAVARIAGILAAKRTPELVALCHSIPLAGVEIDIAPADETTLRIEARTRTVAKTGVEMEALTAASVAALNVYDMLKGVDRELVIDGLRVTEKTKSAVK